MLIILCGKSGCGKDTVAAKLELPRLISTTSRPMRDGETEGVEYNFISRKEFEKRIEKNQFVEYRAYSTLVSGKKDTWYYGTEKKTIDGDYVAIKDLEGAKALKNYYGDAVIVQIIVPNWIREERAKKRGSFDQTEWDRRLKTDDNDFSPEKVMGVVDINVLNNGTVEELVEKIRKEVEDYKNGKV